jgi:hypothetical protein
MIPHIWQNMHAVITSILDYFYYITVGIINVANKPALSRTVLDTGRLLANGLQLGA